MEAKCRWSQQTRLKHGLGPQPGDVGWAKMQTRSKYRLSQQPVPTGPESIQTKTKYGQDSLFLIFPVSQPLGTSSHPSVAAFPQPCTPYPALISGSQHMAAISTPAPSAQCPVLPVLPVLIPRRTPPQRTPGGIGASQGAGADARSSPAVGAGKELGRCQSPAGTHSPRAVAKPPA